MFFRYFTSTGIFFRKKTITSLFRSAIKVTLFHQHVHSYLTVGEVFLCVFFHTFFAHYVVAVDVYDGYVYVIENFYLFSFIFSPKTTI